MGLLACTHLFVSVKCLVNMSADICRVRQYSNVKSLRSKRSHNHAKQMPCVRCMCLMVGFRPVSSTRMAAALSSLNTADPSGIKYLHQYLARDRCEGTLVCLVVVFIKRLRG